MRRSEQRRVRLRADDNIQLGTSVMDKQVLPNFQLSPTAPSVILQHKVEIDHKQESGKDVAIGISSCNISKDLGWQTSRKGLLHSSVKCCCCLVRPAKRPNGAIGYCLARFTERPPGLVGCHVQDCMSEMDVIQALGQEGSRQTRCQFEVASQIEIDLLPTDRSSDMDTVSSVPDHLSAVLATMYTQGGPDNQGTRVTQFCSSVALAAATAAVTHGRNLNIAPDEWHWGIPLRPSGCATKRRYAAVPWLEPERLKTRTVALPDPQNVKAVTYQVWSEALVAVMSVCFCIPFSSILSRFACSDSKWRRTRHFSE
nr:hypothetical protein B9J10.10 [imported] - Neurospora crassa [Neurospora crassa]